MEIDRFQELLWHFASHRVVTVAGRAGIFHELAQTAATAEEVAAACHLDPGPTGKVLRALTALGVLEAEGDRFRVPPPLDAHFRPGDGDFGPFVAHSHHLYESWGHTLEPWLRGETDKLPPREPPPPDEFAAAMRAMGTHVARELAAAFDPQGARRLLDMGGSYGHYAKALCARNPQLHATVLDREAVCELGREAIAGTELAPRITFLGGDYLETPIEPGTYDLVLQANVVHQEFPARAARLVLRGAEALAPGGRLVVLDFAIDDARRQSVMGTLFALNMRSFGDTYTEPQLRAWMEAAGLRPIERQDLNPLRWLIVGTKPSG